VLDDIGVVDGGLWIRLWIDGGLWIKGGLCGVVGVFMVVVMVVYGLCMYLTALLLLILLLYISPLLLLLLLLPYNHTLH
jgi:hypothetical protein